MVTGKLARGASRWLPVMALNGLQLHASPREPRLTPWPQPPAGPRGESAHYDYCLLPYTPKATTARDLASVNLLRWSWQAHGVLAQGEALLQRLHAGLGPGQVVWGIKQRVQQPDAASWELYWPPWAAVMRWCSVAAACCRTPPAWPACSITPP